MPLRFSIHHAFALAAGMALVVPCSAAFAGEQNGWHDGSWHGDSRQHDPRSDAPPPPAQDDPSDAYREGPGDQGGYHYDDGRQGDWRRDDRRNGGQRAQFDPAAREAWLVDCRQRVSSRDRGVGGAVIGGVIGGVAGNRIAGRGNRVVGTVAGAAVGAVAGSAIDRAEDRGRDRDECEAYLDDYYARYDGGGYDAPGGYAQGPGYSGYSYGGCCGGAPVMMVPVQAQPECTETVEYIYEDVPVRPKVYRRVQTKRVKVSPDKRIRIAPDKRINAK